jgi:hypothetical protein
MPDSEQVMPLGAADLIVARNPICIECATPDRMRACVAAELRRSNSPMMEYAQSRNRDGNSTRVVG